MKGIITEEITLDSENNIQIPDSILKRLNIKENDKFNISINEYNVIVLLKHQKEE
tara:strand:- start:147 stop:311 length:165 start_codon:yes stop_codon:yes gene_type:complete